MNYRVRIKGHGHTAQSKGTIDNLENYPDDQRWTAIQVATSRQILRPNGHRDVCLEFNALDDNDAYEWLCQNFHPADERPLAGKSYLRGCRSKVKKGEQPTEPIIVHCSPENRPKPVASVPQPYHGYSPPSSQQLVPIVQSSLQAVLDVVDDQFRDSRLDADKITSDKDNQTPTIRGAVEACNKFVNRLVWGITGLPTFQDAVIEAGLKRVVNQYIATRAMELRTIGDTKATDQLREDTLIMAREVVISAIQDYLPEADVGHWQVELCDVGSRLVSVIKAIRAHTGWGLKKSKDFVDAVRDRPLSLHGPQESHSETILSGISEAKAHKLGEELSAAGAHAIVREVV